MLRARAREPAAGPGLNDEGAQYRSTKSGRIVILEGVCGAGKTTLLGALRDADSGRVAVFAQRETYGPIASSEDAGTLDDAENLSVLLDVSERIVGAARHQDLVLVDTLHATHRCRPGVLSDASFVRVDARLAAVGALVVLLTIDQDAIRSRTVEARRDTGFGRYVRRFGSTDDAIVKYFLREQRQLRRHLCERSRLRMLTLSGLDPTNVNVRTVQAALGRSVVASRLS